MTEGVAEEEQRRAIAQWGRVEAILASDPVIDRIVDDILNHWGKRRELIHGKAMIAAINRAVCVKVYDRIVARRPDWATADDKTGKVKVAFTGDSSDVATIRKHVRTKEARAKLKLRAQDPDDELEIIIVTDLWLTGFDSPALHTLYLAKLMRGHGLFQAVTRPNRVYLDKPAGLIVSYVPVLDALNEAIRRYARPEDAAMEVSTAAALNAFKEKLDIIEGILEGSNWRTMPATTKAEQLERFGGVAHFLMNNEDRAERYLNQALALLKLVAIIGTDDQAEVFRDDVAFYAGVRGVLAKLRGSEPLGPRTRKDLDTAIGQLVAGAIEADEVIDVYAAAGWTSPRSQSLSDEMLKRLTDGKKPHLQFEILRKILNDQIPVRGPPEYRAERPVELSARRCAASLPEPCPLGRGGHRGTRRAREGVTSRGWPA